MTGVIGREWIAAHLPHRGRMSLLHEVVAWDARSLHARALSHRANDNPLRRAGELAVICGVEYGAQAVALHGVLNAQDQSAGLLASVRAVTAHVPRLDDIAGALDIAVEHLAGESASVLYAFRLTSESRELLDGRLTIALRAARCARR